MKKGNLTLKRLEELFNASVHSVSGVDEIAGYIDGVLVIEKKEVPEGEIWMFSMKDFELKKNKQGI